MARLVRALVFVVLLAVLFGLCLWYPLQPPAPEVGAYPDSEDVLHDTDRWVGEPVSVSGPVVDIDPLTMRLSTSQETRRVAVRGSSLAVEEGDRLRVFGTLEDPQTVTFRDGFAVPQDGLLYTYAVSALAVLWVVGRSLRHLWIQHSPLGITVRERGGGDDA